MAKFKSIGWYSGDPFNADVPVHPVVVEFDHTVKVGASAEGRGYDELKAVALDGEQLLNWYTCPVSAS